MNEKQEEREYRTGQGVPKSASYQCQSGERHVFSENDEFPTCPVTDEDTVWKHHDEQTER